MRGSYADRLGEDGITHPDAPRRADEPDDPAAFNREMQERAVAFLKACGRIVFDEAIERWTLV